MSKLRMAASAAAAIVLPMSANAGEGVKDYQRISPPRPSIACKEIDTTQGQENCKESFRYWTKMHVKDVSHRLRNPGMIKIGVIGEPGINMGGKENKTRPGFKSNVILLEPSRKDKQKGSILAGSVETRCAPLFRGSAEDTLEDVIIQTDKCIKASGEAQRAVHLQMFNSIITAPLPLIAKKMEQQKSQKEYDTALKNGAYEYQLGD